MEGLKGYEEMRGWMAALEGGDSRLQMCVTE